MALKKDHFTYHVTWSEDDNEYVGLCTEFPGLSWLAKTPESALKGIRDVIADVVSSSGFFVEKNNITVWRSFLSDG